MVAIIVIAPHKLTKLPGIVRIVQNPLKLVCHAALTRRVAIKLKRHWSPKQIAGWLKRTYPNEEHKEVSHETIYRSLFIQRRGVTEKRAAIVPSHSTGDTAR